MAMLNGHMPNCDFYAAKNDLDAVLTFVFDDMNCRVFESYSQPDNSLIEFGSLAQLLSVAEIGACDLSGHSALLQLWPIAASDNVNIKKFQLDPTKSNGAQFRYNIEGWGLIQLYLGGIRGQKIFHSHTNHNSEKRALKWSDTYSSELGNPKVWNWKTVTSESGKLNRFIRKLAISTNNGRPILPYASALIDDGYTLD